MMDDGTRRMLEEAYAQDDRVRADFERWQTKQQQEQIERRCAPFELVHKTFAPVLQPRQSAVMDAEQQRRGDEWATALIERAFAAQPLFSEAQAGVIAKTISLLRAEMDSQ
jgi:hypothetical protein